MTNWRIRVLERLEQNKEILSSKLERDEYEKLAKIAELYRIHPIVNDSLLEEGKGEQRSFDDDRQTEYERKTYETKVLCKAQQSFLQCVYNNDIPVHLQVIVPNAIGTNDLTPIQAFEVNTWFIAVSRIAAEEDVGLVFFEFCEATDPLCVDIFPAPTDETTYHLFRSAFEENINDLEEQSLIKLRSHIQKNIFRKGSQYLAVTFDDGDGIGKLYNFEENPRASVIEIVKNMWDNSKEEPPEDFIDRIKNYKDWPK